MKLSSLLSHSAQLFDLIWKSPQPADNLAGYYLSSKKYIGSKERNFISEAVFSMLRIRSLAAACSSGVLDGAAPAGDFNAASFLLAAATCLLAMNHPAGKYKFSISNVILLLYGSREDFRNELVTAIQEKLSVTSPQAQSWLSDTEERFAGIDSRARLVLASDVAPGAAGATGATGLEALSLRYSMPVWILENWLKNYDSNNYPGNGSALLGCARLAESLMFAANVCLRVNTRSMTRPQAIDELRANGVECSPGRLSPHCIVLARRAQLNSLQLYKSGAIEVQEEASQLTAFAMAPEAYWRVLDACAGAGGKTLHIATLQNDMGQISATDVELSRLKEISRRAGRHGFKSIRTILLNKSLMKATQGKDASPLAGQKFDALLIDAPCSGMGTVRRMPMAKWRLTPELLGRHAAKQLELLQYFSNFLKPGGVLVYSTCSLMPEENDQVVGRFLAGNKDFAPGILGDALQDAGISIEGLSGEAHSITLMPSEHGTDGFYIARLVKSI